MHAQTFPLGRRHMMKAGGVIQAAINVAVFAYLTERVFIKAVGYFQPVCARNLDV